MKSKRVLFCLSHVNFWLQLESVGEVLAQRGADVTVLFDPRKCWKFDHRFQWNADGKGYALGQLKDRYDAVGRAAENLREALNYLSYFSEKRAPFNSVLAGRWTEHLSTVFWRLFHWHRVCRWLTSPPPFQALQYIANSAPLFPAIIDDLERRKPDLVVAVPTLLPLSLEYEYLRTAQRLGYPTAVIVPSWDNLTTKGIFHMIPDKIFVWNQAQIREAMEIFDIPSNRLQATGAPRYDRWFRLKPSRTREEFCAEAGLDPKRPFVVWLCSSQFIANEEEISVSDAAKAIADDPELQKSGVQLLVRPHFQNLQAWAKFIGEGRKDLHLWPGPNSLESFDPDTLHQDFYDTLTHCSAVVGLNTSAFLEASIVDRPCLTVLDERFAATQSGLPHFEHLVKGGFLMSAKSPQELSANLRTVLAGDDPLADARRAFVKNFLRPGGLDRNASEILADGLEALANSN